MNGGWGISYEIALRWMPLDLTDDKSTLVQVMAWCRQATSHYLSQCWPRSMSPYGVTGPQWVKLCKSNCIPQKPWLQLHIHPWSWVISVSKRDTSCHLKPKKILNNMNQTHIHTLVLGWYCCISKMQFLTLFGVFRYSYDKNLRMNVTGPW